MIRASIVGVALCAVLMSSAAEARVIVTVASNEHLGPPPKVDQYAELTNSDPDGIIDVVGTNIQLDMTVSQLHEQFFLLVTTAAGPDTLYNFTVNLLNDAAKPMGPLDVALVTQAANTLLPGTSPTRLILSQYGHYLDSNPANSKNIRIGGLNGGGVYIAPGDTGTVGFNLLVGNTPSLFRLRFTANPEPGSIILASMLACAMGGFLYYQRKRQTQAASMVA